MRSTAMPARYALERGQWAEAAALIEIPGAAPNVQAMTFFARGLGLARGRGDLAAARAEVAKLETALRAMTAANQTYDAEQIEIQKRSVSAWIALAEGRRPTPRWPKCTRLPRCRTRPKIRRLARSDRAGA